MKPVKISALLAAIFAVSLFSITAFAEETKNTHICSDDFEAIFSIELSEEEAELITKQIEADRASCTETYNNKEALYDFSNDYYYNQLDDAGKSLYDDLVICCEAFADSTVDITATTESGNGLFNYVTCDKTLFTHEELREIYYAFYYSNPQFFFLANGLASSTYGTTLRVYPIVEDEGPNFLLYSSRSKYSKRIDEITNEWMKEINSCSTDYQKEKLICEKLCNHITYTFSGIDQSLAGALVDKACVCNGYAMAVSYFCNAAEIDCITVVSKNHAWNNVKLNDKWYEVDATWMDQSGYIWYDWFNKSNLTFTENDMENMHSIDTQYYDDLFTLPVCGDDCLSSIDIPQFSSFSPSVNKAVLYWNPVENASSYRIYRSDSYTGAKTFIKAVNTTSYTDTTVEEGKSYFYFLKAYNGTYGISSDYSFGACVDIPVIPKAPVNITPVSGGGNITITWDPVKYATSYRIFRSDSLTGTRKLEKVRTSTYYIDTNVDTGKTYYYWIITYNANTGYHSNYSAASKATVTDDFAASIEIKSVSVLSTAATLKWDMVPGATSYRIYRRNDDGTRSLLYAQSMTEYKDTGLTKGKAYTYEIRAYSKTTGALTAYSPKKTVRPMAAPTILSGNVKGKITWDKNLVATSYRVYRADSLTGTKKLLAPTQALAYTDTTAVKGKTYYYFVAAYDNTTGTLSAYSQPKAILIS